MFDRVTSVLVLEPHPDDLAIGCGGLVARLTDRGAKVHTLLFSDVPERYRKIYDDSGEYRDYSAQARRTEAEAADSVLGVASRSIAFTADWHHRLDALPASELIDCIERRVSEVGADLVLVPARSYNQDHRAVHDAFLSVMRPHFFRGAAVAYETTMERDFTPTLVVPLAREDLARKLDACSRYVTQLGAAEHLFSLETVELSARYRGRLGFTPAAEAFELLRGTWA